MKSNPIVKECWDMCCFLASLMSNIIKASTLVPAPLSTYYINTENIIVFFVIIQIINSLMNL